MQGWASENEKLALTHFLPKFDFFKKMHLTTEVVQPRVHHDTSNCKFINKLWTSPRKLRRHSPAVESTQKIGNWDDSRGSNTGSSIA